MGWAERVDLVRPTSVLDRMVLGVVMRILAVKHYTGKKQLEVIARVHGKVVVVPYHWHDKSESDVPTGNWFKTVQMELREYSARTSPQGKASAMLRKFASGG